MQEKQGNIFFIIFFLMGGTWTLFPGLYLYILYNVIVMLGRAVWALLCTNPRSAVLRLPPTYLWRHISGPLWVQNPTVASSDNRCISRPAWALSFAKFCLYICHVFFTKPCGRGDWQVSKQSENTPTWVKPALLNTAGSRLLSRWPFLQASC